MNKTVTINISGIIFHIEEDAYESLSKYLSTIKGYFSTTEGGNEIMTDIEARIAELLQQKLNAGKQVILLSDVDYVKEVMGKPEDFGAESDGGKKGSENLNEENFQYQEKIKRRLFRNPDEKVIGGVCSGLAAYFDVDIVWVRLAMFALIFFGGLSLWVYIIMWIIIPEAKSTADRLAMKGEAANVNTIYKTFKEEAEDLKNRASKTFKEETQDFKHRANKFGQSIKNQNYGERVRSNISVFLTNFFNVIGRLFGLFLVLIGGVLLLAYLTSITGITIINSNTDLQHWKSAIFQTQSVYALSVLAFIVVVGVPVFMLLYAGIKLLFHIRYSNRWVNLVLGIVWVLGLILAGFVSVVTVKQFSESSRIKESVELHGMGDTIVIKMRPGIELVKTLKADNNDDIETYLSNNHSGYTFAEYDKHLSIIGYARLNVTESVNDSVELIVHQNSRGVSKREANSNAKAIEYKYQVNGNEILLDQIFMVDTDIKFRAQTLDLKLRIPKGKVVYFDKSVKHLLDDVDNTTNTWDGDMISRRWKMTEKGLACIDCENLTSVEDHQNKNKDDDIVIDEEGVRVNGKDSKIEIDKEGIRIKTPEEEVRIDNELKLKSKKKKQEENDDEDKY